MNSLNLARTVLVQGSSESTKSCAAAGYRRLNEDDVHARFIDKCRCFALRFPAAIRDSNVHVFWTDGYQLISHLMESLDRSTIWNFGVRRTLDRLVARYEKYTVKILNRIKLRSCLNSSVSLVDVKQCNQRSTSRCQSNRGKLRRQRINVGINEHHDVSDGVIHGEVSHKCGLVRLGVRPRPETTRTQRFE